MPFSGNNHSEPHSILNMKHEKSVYSNETDGPVKSSSTLFHGLTLIPLIKLFYFFPQDVESR